MKPSLVDLGQTWRCRADESMWTVTDVSPMDRSRDMWVRLVYGDEVDYRAESEMLGDDAWEFVSGPEDSA